MIFLKHILIRSLLVVTVLILSCSKKNFQLITQEDGSIVKLNTTTGEMFLLKGDTIVNIIHDTLKVPIEQVTEKPKTPKKKMVWKRKIRSKYDASFAKDRSISVWEDLRFKKDGKRINAKATLRSRYTEGDIQYIFRMRIVSNACWRQDTHDLTIQLQDASGNTLKEINIHAGSKNIVRQPDKRTIDLCVTGEIECEEETYGQFKRWFLQWTWYQRIMQK